MLSAQSSTSSLQAMLPWGDTCTVSKNARSAQAEKDSFAGEPGKVDLPLHSILVADPNLVSWKRPDFENFQHRTSL